MLVTIALLSTFLMKGILSDDGFCKDYLSEEGVVFRPYPGDCTKYVQCQREGDNVTETILTCPFGQFWDADKETCRPSSLVRCKYDPCKDAYTGFTYGMSGFGCRAYWKCVDGFSVAHCCPQGVAYVEGMGCVEKQRCNETCPASG